MSIKNQNMNKNLILSAWLDAMKIVGVPRNDWPKSQPELDVMLQSLDRITIKYQLHEIDSIIGAIRKHAENLAIENAKKSSVYPTFTIGHVHQAIEKHSTPPMQDKLLKSDGLTPEQREIEEFWKQDIETIASVKIPEFINTINQGYGYAVRAILSDRKELMEHIMDKIDVVAVKDKARRDFDGSVVSMYGMIGEKAVKGRKSPDEIMKEIEKAVLKPGMSGGYVRDTFPDYQLLFIKHALNLYNQNILKS